VLRARLSAVSVRLFGIRIPLEMLRKQQLPQMRVPVSSHSPIGFHLPFRRWALSKGNDLVVRHDDFPFILCVDLAAKPYESERSLPSSTSYSNINLLHTVTNGAGLQIGHQTSKTRIALPLAARVRIRLGRQKASTS